MVVITFIDAQEASNYVEYIKYSVQSTEKKERERKKRTSSPSMLIDFTTGFPAQLNVSSSFLPDLSTSDLVA